MPKTSARPTSIITMAFCLKEEWMILSMRLP